MRSSNINRINNDALLPTVLHSITDLLGTVVTNQRTHQIHSSINPTNTPSRSHNPHPTQSHRAPSNNTLSTRITHPPHLTPLPQRARRRLTLLARNLLEHVRVMLQVLSEIEAALINDVSFSIAEHLRSGLEFLLS